MQIPHQVRIKQNRIHLAQHGAKAAGTDADTEAVTGGQGAANTCSS